jgi:hypothetical protein
MAAANGLCSTEDDLPEESDTRRTQQFMSLLLLMSNSCLKQER